ncbi:reverse transcriptase domain-containing protein, partial [Tanacetum coccineum]
MTHLLEKETSFIFSKERVDAFETLKQKLTETPILVAPNLDLPFEIMCDASNFADRSHLHEGTSIYSWPSITCRNGLKQRRSPPMMPKLFANFSNLSSPDLELPVPSLVIASFSQALIPLVSPLLNRSLQPIKDDSQNRKQLMFVAVPVALAIKELLDCAIYKVPTIAISELKKLIKKSKGKSVKTKFDKPLVVRQTNAIKVPKPSILGTLTPFSDSLEKRKNFKTK